jgi:hypothetical protein
MYPAFLGLWVREARRHHVWTFPLPQGKPHGVAEAYMYPAFLGLWVREARRHHGNPKREARPDHPDVLNDGSMTDNGLRAAADIRGRSP